MEMILKRAQLYIEQIVFDILIKIKNALAIEFVSRDYKTIDKIKRIQVSNIHHIHYINIVGL